MNCRLRIFCLAYAKATPIFGCAETTNTTRRSRRDLATLGYKIEQLWDDPKRLAQMRENALAFARPNGAMNIAEKLLDLGGETAL